MKRIWLIPPRHLYDDGSIDGEIWNENETVYIVIRDLEYGGYYELSVNIDDLKDYGFDYIPEGA